MILLDTHVLLWLRSGDRRLGAIARDSIDASWRSGEVAVSAFSFWEIAMLKMKNRISFTPSLEYWHQTQLAQGLIEIPVNGKIAMRAGTLANFHGDPADRLIVSTALEGYRLVTADERILNWHGQLDRLSALL